MLTLSSMENLIVPSNLLCNSYCLLKCLFIRVGVSCPIWYSFDMIFKDFFIPVGRERES